MRRKYRPCLTAIMFLFLSLLTTSCQNRFQPQESVGLTLILNQGIGKGVSEEDGSLYPMEYLVAKRHTRAMVEISGYDGDKVSFDDISLQVTGPDFQMVLTPLTYDQKNNLFLFPIYTWEAGTYQFRAEGFGKEAEVQAQFRPMKDLRILAVGINGYYHIDEADVHMTDLDLDDYTRRVYPLGDDDLFWQCHPEILDLDDKFYDLDTALGRYRVWQELANLSEANQDYDLVVGVVSNNMYPDKNADTASITGFTFGRNISVISLEDTAPSVSVAHEIGHCYGLGDEYSHGSVSLNKNKVPYGMMGNLLENPIEIVTGENPHIIGGRADDTQSSGTIIQAKQYPYDIDTGRLIDREMTSFMGLSGYSESEYWVTPGIWVSMYDTLAEKGGEEQ